MSNYNPKQSQQADKDLSQILNPKKSQNDIYLERQEEIESAIGECRGYRGKVVVVKSANKSSNKVTIEKVCRQIPTQIKNYSNLDLNQMEQRL